ncbi:hypothetical protein L1887_50702 [Cichorium endivia]|nr:hypothetical protein L1887_50702 [Cichorium endivia]
MEHKGEEGRSHERSANPRVARALSLLPAKPPRTAAGGGAPCQLAGIDGVRPSAALTPFQKFVPKINDRRGGVFSQSEAAESSRESESVRALASGRPSRLSTSSPFAIFALDTQPPRSVRSSL